MCVRVRERERETDVGKNDVLNVGVKVCAKFSLFSAHSTTATTLTWTATATTVEREEGKKTKTISN